VKGDWATGRADKREKRAIPNYEKYGFLGSPLFSRGDVRRTEGYRNKNVLLINFKQYNE